MAVIVNPATRGDATSLLDTLRAAAPSDVELDVRLTTAAGEAVMLARAAVQDAAFVVAVGGDGTVADVVSGMHGSGLPLGIIPAGSTNIIARELGIPTDRRAAAALLFNSHRLATLDVGRCGQRSFLHMAGAGLDSRFFDRTNPAHKRRVGWLAYLPSAALALRLPPARFTITAHGRTITITSPLVLVANGASVIAPGLRLHPAIRADDGWLDVLVFTATRGWSVARTLAEFAFLKLAQSPYVLRIRARRVDLRAEPTLPVQLDGDVVERTPATFEILPRAIQVISPLSRQHPPASAHTARLHQS